MSYTIDKFIAESNGKFITVDFIKKDGSTRTINGRLGVKKHLQGGKCTIDKDKYFIIYENNNGYRAVNKETVFAIRCGNVSITFNK